MSAPDTLVELRLKTRYFGDDATILILRSVSRNSDLCALVQKHGSVVYTFGFCDPGASAYSMFQKTNRREPVTEFEMSLAHFVSNLDRDCDAEIDAGEVFAPFIFADVYSDLLAEKKTNRRLSKKLTKSLSEKRQ